MRWSWIAWVVVAVVVALPAAALAQSENKAAADAAFERGKQLMDDGQTAEACAEFKRSQELDPQFGTQYNLALCYQKLGKLASAYGEFVELAEKDTKSKRKAESKKIAAKLKPRLTQLTLIVNQPAPSLTVKRDDQDITLLVGVTTPVDPGVYVFKAEAPGHETWEQQVDLTAEGATITVEVPALEKKAAVETEPDPEPDPEPEPGRGTGTGMGTGGGSPGEPPSKTRKYLGMGLTGGGVIMTGVGLFFGFQANTLSGDAKDTCGGQLDPCQGDVLGAREDIEDAKSKAMLSNIFVGAGLVAVTAGVILWVTAPDGGGERSTALVPVVGDGNVGLVLDGRF